MAEPQQVDYGALADQARKSAPVDYAALADQARATAKPDFTTQNETDESGHSVVRLPSGHAVNLEGLSPDVAQGFRDLASGTEPPKSPLAFESLPGTAKDVAVGALKGLAREGIRGGALLRKIPGVDTVANALPSVSVPVNPTNTAQKIGGALEQAAEVAAPSRAVAAGGVKVAELAAPVLSRVLSPTLARLVPEMLVGAVGNAALAKAQGATNAEAGTTGAISATLPTIGQVAVSLANKLRGGAAENVYKFFAPTTKLMKTAVSGQTPEILNRGSEVLGTLGRSREGAQEVFSAARQKAGEAVDAALQQFGDESVRDAPQRLMAALDSSKAPYVKTRIVDAASVSPAQQAFVVGPMPDGRVQLAVPLSPKAKQIDALKQIVQAHGDDMTVDDLVGLRRAWDEIAYSGSPTLKPSAKWAKKMGGDAIRAILATDHPDLTAVNREFHFWSSLDDAMSATVTRKVGQSGGLLPTIAEGAGATAVAAATGSVGAGFAGGKLAKAAQQVFASPRWNAVAANIKNKLAAAIVERNNPAASFWLRMASRNAGIAAIEGPRDLAEASR